LQFTRPAAELPPPDNTEPHIAGANAPAGAVHLAEAFETGPQEHVYLEPQSLAASFEAGTLTVRGSMQCPYYVKTALTMLTGLSPSAVRVVQDTTGGGFGGKEEFPSLIACALAVAAMKSGRPVRMLLDRDEDIRIST
jgi:xanthine dehydrogenase molybdopterin-binding subunit B